jgi:hypothetical protein
LTADLSHSPLPDQLQLELVLGHSLTAHLMAQLLVQEEAYLLDKVDCRYGNLAVQGRLARLASTSWSMVTFPQILKL